jgi:predicted glycosyltransferase
VLPGVEYFYPHLVSLYPVMDVLEAADLVICAAGYNSFAEVTHLGARTLFRPIDRTLDRQSERTMEYPTFESAISDEALAARMRQVLDGPPPRKGAPKDYKGAELVAEAIANAMALV